MKLLTLLVLVTVVLACSDLCAQAVPGAQPSQVVRQNWEAQKLKIEKQWQAAAKELHTFEAMRDDKYKRLNELKISEASYLEVMRLLQTQRIQLMIDLAGLQARLQIEREVAAESGLKQDESDESLKLLKKYVANQQNIVDNVKTNVAAGLASSIELEKARGLLLEAQLKLAQATASDGAVESRRQFSAKQRMTDTALENAEKTAKLRMVEELLVRYSDARTHVDSLAMLQRQYEIQLERVSELKFKLSEAEALIQSNMPKNDDH